MASLYLVRYSYFSCQYLFVFRYGVAFDVFSVLLVFGLTMIRCLLPSFLATFPNPNPLIFWFYPFFWLGLGVGMGTALWMCNFVSKLCMVRYPCSNIAEILKDFLNIEGLDKATLVSMT